MKSLEDRYINYLIENQDKVEYPAGLLIGDVINELIDDKYSRKKIRVKASLRTNRIIKKLKLIYRKYSKKQVNFSVNTKKGLVLKSMLELIENQEKYIKQLDNIITFDNYDEIVLLINFLDKEFDNNFRYLNFLMEYITNPKIAYEQTEKNQDLEDTRYEVEGFFKERYEHLKPKIKQK